jgi:hypothetical protein
MSQPQRRKVFTIFGVTAAVNGTRIKMKLLWIAYASASWVQIPRGMRLDNVHVYASRYTYWLLPGSSPPPGRGCFEYPRPHSGQWALSGAKSSGKSPWLTAPRHAQSSQSVPRLTGAQQQSRRESPMPTDRNTRRQLPSRIRGKVCVSVAITRFPLSPSVTKWRIPNCSVGSAVVSGVGSIEGSAVIARPVGQYSLPL